MVKNNNLKVMTFPVTDENELMVALDVLSIKRGVYGVNVEDDYELEILFDVTMTSEDDIDKTLFHYLDNADNLEELYDEIALNDIHCDLQQLIEMGYFSKDALED